MATFSRRHLCLNPPALAGGSLVELSGYVAYTYKKYKNDVFVWVNGKRFEVKNQIKLN
jgi:hypothetical protein